MEGMDLNVIIPTVVALIGIVTAAIQSIRLNQATGVVVPYLEGLAAFEEGFADKNLTDEELIKVGKKASAHYAALKGIFIKE
ncbi:MAG: hypothetical protein WC415_04380 [Patescibacteria group bacterium]|jgi:CO dehydrogenase/acetyl-CoA synthase alpha subunit